MDFIKVCESLKQFSKLYCKWGKWLCFEKNLWKFKQNFQILFKNLKDFLKFLKVLKKMLIKIRKN